MGFLIIILLLTPILGGLIGYIAKFNAGIYASIGVSFPLIISIYLLITKAHFVWTFEWLPGYQLSVLIDSVALVLIGLVSLISTLVHIFSIEYMSSDQGKNRYFLKLGFFTFSMIGLLISNHLILLFVFWELVGFASYLLIGFWYKKEGIPQSARLAFIVNRIADVGLLAGILMLNEIGLIISEMQSTWLLLPSILIAIGAFGKSAQLPFSGWLTKAMVGPTPVSALIHAATMVAAGVYLLFRVSSYLHGDAMIMIAIVGTFTALYGGLSALLQNDIKKVLAYSTISQLGYMVIGIGVGAKEASLFHLFTHAFFKAGLFLGAGAIIHFMHQVSKVDAQDMRYMGGLKKYLPWTYRSFLVCALALAGIPLFSGFMSKEGIIIAGWEWAGGIGKWAYLVPDLALITAFLTAFYVGRLVLLVFWGQNRLKETIDEFSESVLMKLPLIVLAIGSLWIFYNWNPLAHETWLSAQWGDNNTHGSDFISMMVTFLSLLMASAGLVLAFSFFKPNSSYIRSYDQMSAGRFHAIQSGFYLTSFYNWVAQQIEKVSTFTSHVDLKVVDGAIHFVAIGGVVFSKVIALIDRFLVDGPVNLVGFISRWVGRILAAVSSRDLQTQLAWLLLGFILILSLILLV